MTNAVQAAVATVARHGKNFVKTYAVIKISDGPAASKKIGLHLASNNYRSGDIERPVQNAIADAMFDGAVFFDIGANVGFFTLVAAGAVDDAATLVAFEPRADVAEALAKNMRRNQLDVDVWEAAVGDRDGTIELLVAGHPGGATIEPTKAVDTTGTCSVRQVTIDALVAKGLVPMPDVVKIDVEGAEPAVVRGMASTLRAGGPTVIYEIDAATSDEADDQFERVDSLLRDAGYTSVRLDPSYESSGWTVIHAIARPDDRD